MKKMKKTKTDIKQIAREKINDRIGFLSHFVIYVLSSCAFLGIDFFITKEADWAYLPLFVWGIALFSHGFTVVLKDLFTEIKEKMVENEYEKLRNEKK